MNVQISISLSGPKKWVKVREAIQKTHGINVNFSIKSAYKYVTKSDGVGVSISMIKISTLVLLGEVL